VGLVRAGELEEVIDAQRGEQRSLPSRSDGVDVVHSLLLGIDDYPARPFARGLA